MWYFLSYANAKNKQRVAILQRFWIQKLICFFKNNCRKEVGNCTQNCRNIFLPENEPTWPNLDHL